MGERPLVSFLDTAPLIILLSVFVVDVCDRNPPWLAGMVFFVVFTGLAIAILHIRGTR